MVGSIKRRLGIEGIFGPSVMVLTRIADRGNWMYRFAITMVSMMIIPVCGYSQAYADTPFYKVVHSVPDSARVEGWQHGSITANGVRIDLSELHSPHSVEDLQGWSVGQHVDGADPDQVFHFYIQYEGLDVTFGYDLLVRPIPGTNRIRLFLPNPQKGLIDRGRC
jgi:hypothetical protein